MRRRHHDQGSIATEHALLVGLIALVVIAGVTALGVATVGLFPGPEFP